MLVDTHHVDEFSVNSRLRALGGENTYLGGGGGVNLIHFLTFFAFWVFFWAGGGIWDSGGNPPRR